MKKILSLILSIALVFSCAPAFSVTAFAEEDYITFLKKIRVNAGQYVNSDGDIVNEEPADNYIYYEGNGKITLKNAVFSWDKDAAIYSEGKDVYVTLIGENKFENTSNANNCLEIIFGTLYISGEGSLSSGRGIFCEEFVLSGGTLDLGGSVDSSGDITVSGGNINIAGASGSGMKAMSDGNISITGGNVTVSGGLYGLYSVGGDISVTRGKVTATVSTYGLYSSNGKVSVTGGEVELTVTGTGSTEKAINGSPVFISEDMQIVEGSPEEKYVKITPKDYINILGQKVNAGYYVNSYGNIVNEEPADNYIYYEGDGKITLKNAVFSGYTGEAIHSDGKDIDITLIGENKFIGDAGLPWLSIAPGKLHISGEGSLNCNQGIIGRGIVLSGGTLNLDKNLDSIGDITVSGGNINITGSGYMKAMVENNSNIAGNIYITGGNVTVSGDLYGLYSVGGAVSITGGEVELTATEKVIFGSPVTNGENMQIVEGSPEGKYVKIAPKEEPEPQEDYINVLGERVYAGEYFVDTDNIVNEEPADNYVYYEGNGKITLKNAVFSGYTGDVIYSKDKDVYVTLIGENKFMADTGHVCLSTAPGKLHISGEGSLSSYDGIAARGIVFSGGTLDLDGSLDSMGDITVSGGSINITGFGGMKAMVENNSNIAGNIYITGGKVTVSSESMYGLYSVGGAVSVTGGEVELTATEKVIFGSPVTIGENMQIVEGSLEGTYVKIAPKQENEAAWETAEGVWTEGDFIDALAGVYDGGTVRLLKNVDLADVYNIGFKKGQITILDTNGKTIDTNYVKFEVPSNAIVEIKGGGTIYCDEQSMSVHGTLDIVGVNFISETQSPIYCGTWSKITISGKSVISGADYALDILAADWVIVKGDVELRVTGESAYASEIKVYETTKVDISEMNDVEGIRLRYFTGKGTELILPEGYLWFNDEGKAVVPENMVNNGIYTAKKHSHDFGTDWLADENGHWLECSCGAVKDEGTHSGGTATCDAKAICEVCGFEHGEINPENHDHSGELLSDGTHHYRVCARIGCDEILDKEACSGGTATCTAKAICEVCGFEHGEIDSENHDHSGELLSDGTHHYRVCARTGCDEIIDKEACSGGTATCTAKAICEVCGFEHGEIDPENHDHSGELLSDGTNHYRVCARTGCDEIIDKEACSGGTATCTAKAICEVCGFEHGEIDPENHGEHGTVIKGAFDATCTKSGYTGDTHCEGCDAILEHGKVSPVVPHPFGRWETIKEATVFSTGLERRECSECGFAEEKVIPKKEHSGTIVIDMNGKTETETNPETGAPVILPMAAIILASAAAAVYKKRG